MAHQSKQNHHKSLNIPSSTSALEVVKQSLLKKDRQEDLSHFLLIIEENGEVKRKIGNDEDPVIILNEYQKHNQHAKIRLVLHQKEFIEKIEKNLGKTYVLKIYHDQHHAAKNGSVAVFTFEVHDDTSSQELIEACAKKFRIKNDILADCFIYVYCQETGALRKLQKHEKPLDIRDEIILQNSIRKGGSSTVNLKWLIKQHPKETLKIFPIRVYVEKVFPGEGYKSVPANIASTAREILEITLRKIKPNSDCTVEDFALYQMIDEGEILIYANEVIPTTNPNFLLALKSDPKSAQGSRRKVNPQVQREPSLGITPASTSNFLPNFTSNSSSNPNSGNSNSGLRTSASDTSLKLAALNLGDNSDTKIGNAPSSSSGVRTSASMTAISMIANSGDKQVNSEKSKSDPPSANNLSQMSSLSSSSSLNLVENQQQELEMDIISFLGLYDDLIEEEIDI